MTLSQDNEDFRGFLSICGFDPQSREAARFHSFTLDDYDAPTTAVCQGCGKQTTAKIAEQYNFEWIDQFLQEACFNYYEVKRGDYGFYDADELLEMVKKLTYWGLRFMEDIHPVLVADTAPLLMDQWEEEFSLHPRVPFRCAHPPGRRTPDSPVLRCAVCLAALPKER